MYTYICEHVNECKCTHTHIYTYIHTYIHTHTCTLQISSKGQVKWNATWSVSQDLPVHYVGGAGAADHYAHILGRAGAADYTAPSGTAAASSSLLCKGHPVDLGIVIDNRALDDNLYAETSDVLSFGMGNFYHFSDDEMFRALAFLHGDPSVFLAKWFNVKQMLKSLLAAFDIGLGHNQTRVGIVTRYGFSNPTVTQNGDVITNLGPTVQLLMNESTDRSRVLSILDNMNTTMDFCDDREYYRFLCAQQTVVNRPFLCSVLLNPNKTKFNSAEPWGPCMQHVDDAEAETWGVSFPALSKLRKEVLQEAAGMRGPSDGIPRAVLHIHPHSQLSQGSGSRHQQQWQDARWGWYERYKVEEAMNATSVYFIAPYLTGDNQFRAETEMLASKPISKHLFLVESFAAPDLIASAVGTSICKDLYPDLYPPCPPGFNGPDGGACDACPVDTYKNTSGHSGCTQCPSCSTTLGLTGRRRHSDCVCNPGCTKSAVVTADTTCKSVASTCCLTEAVLNGSESCLPDEALRNRFQTHFIYSPEEAWANEFTRPRGGDYPAFGIFSNFEYNLEHFPRQVFYDHEYVPLSPPPPEFTMYYQGLYQEWLEMNPWYREVYRAIANYTSPAGVVDWWGFNDYWYDPDRPTPAWNQKFNEFLDENDWAHCTYGERDSEFEDLFWYWEDDHFPLWMQMAHDDSGEKIWWFDDQPNLKDYHKSFCDCDDVDTSAEIDYLETENLARGGWPWIDPYPEDCWREVSFDWSYSSEGGWEQIKNERVFCNQDWEVQSKLYFSSAAGIDWHAWNALWIYWFNHLWGTGIYAGPLEHITWHDHGLGGMYTPCRKFILDDGRYWPKKKPSVPGPEFCYPCPAGEHQGGVDAVDDSGERGRLLLLTMLTWAGRHILGRGRGCALLSLSGR